MTTRRPGWVEFYDEHKGIIQPTDVETEDLEQHKFFPSALVNVSSVKQGDVVTFVSKVTLSATDKKVFEALEVQIAS